MSERPQSLEPCQINPGDEVSENVPTLASTTSPDPRMGVQVDPSLSGDSSTTTTVLSQGTSNLTLGVNREPTSGGRQRSEHPERLYRRTK